MKKILKIARVELSILFYSPVAWLVLIIFCIQCGISFSGILADKEASQQLGNSLNDLTANIFTGRYGFLTAIQNNLYLYIPLLTMGLMSREISSGSLKLLLSSPVTSAQIILGKFASIMAYGLVFMLILLLCLFMGAYAIEAMDFGLVLAGLFGLYLLICAYAAIGIFLSSLTAYQVVAAISTLAALAALKFVGQIGQSMDFVREITYWLSIDGRVDTFIGGLISSRDLVYFLLVIFLFLALTIMHLDAGRVIRSSAARTLRYCGLILIVLALGFFSSRPAFTGYYDATRFKARTLTKASQEIIKEIDGRVTLTSYVNVLNRFAHVGAPKFRIFERNQFEQFLRYLPDMKISYVPYYDTTMMGNRRPEMSLEESAQRAATAHGFDFTQVRSPEEIKKIIDLVPEENRFVRIMHYKDQSTPLRMFNDMEAYPSEAEVSAALKRLLHGPAQVGVLTGNEERSIFKSGDKEYQNITTTVSIRYALINQGFDIQTVALDTVDRIPELDVLVVADPMIAYTRIQQEKIANYIERGGNVLFAGEPRKQALLNPLTEPLGVRFKAGTLLQESKEYALDLIQAKPTKESKGIGLSLPGKRPIVSLSNAVALDWSKNPEFTLVPLLRTDSSAWIKKGVFNIESDSIKYDPQTDQQGSAMVGLALTRDRDGQTQKIVVMGDADFMSNGELGRRNLQTENTNFTIQLFRWFSDNAYPIDASRPAPIDNRITVNKGVIDGMRWTMVGVLPLIFALFGATLLIRRKRQ